ncbi:MAG: outer membrane lipoprotein carrier protein LolA [Bacteroidetes bacterium]|nr:outer membrane lipoprotein carrier protein LolA [Bacteroidota bacterium]
MIARSALACLVLFAALVLTAGHPAAHAQTADAQQADAVFDRLLAKYNAIDALRAEFTQTMSSSYMDQEESFTGLLILQGEKFRIETATEVLVVNGQETYVYRPNEQQVLISDVVEDEASFLPTDFLLHHDERFDVLDVDVVTYNGERHYRLNLKPKSADSFFREATLWMRDRDDIITKMTVLDVNETRMVFTLDNIELNPSLDADTFNFTPPDGVEIIDLRS